MSADSGSKVGQTLAGFAIGLAAVAAAVFGLLVLFNPDPDPSVTSEEAPAKAQDTDLASDDAETDGASETSVGTETESEPVAQAVDEDASSPSVPGAPEVSTFRLEPDGQMLIAGRSLPGWETTVRLDADAIATFLPDENGEFVKFLEVDPSEQPRVLSLSARSPETGVDVVSDAEIIIAPLPEMVTSAVDQVDKADEALKSASEPESELAAASDDTLPQPVGDSTEEGAPGLSDDERIAINETQDGSEAATGTNTSSEGSGSQTAVLISDEEGVRVLQTPSGDQPPEVMSEVALDTISYSETGDVELAGRAAGDGFVRVYVDNAPVVTSQIEEDGGWRSDLPELGSGVYTLRIDEVTEDGTVLSRVETPFQREDEQVLANAMASGSAVRTITVQPGFTLWGISRQRYGDGFQYLRIYDANKDLIRDPDLIYPGQVFSLPQ